PVASRPSPLCRPRRETMGGMPGSNLSRDESAARAALIRADNYVVELDLTGSETTFGSTTTLEFGCTTPGASTFVDLVGANIESLTLNGQKLDPSEVYSDNRLELSGLAEENVLQVMATLPY